MEGLWLSSAPASGNPRAWGRSMARPRVGSLAGCVCGSRVIHFRQGHEVSHLRSVGTLPDGPKRCNYTPENDDVATLDARERNRADPAPDIASLAINEPYLLVHVVEAVGRSLAKLRHASHANDRGAAEAHRLFVQSLRRQDNRLKSEPADPDEGRLTVTTDKRQRGSEDPRLLRPDVAADEILPKLLDSSVVVVAEEVTEIVQLLNRARQKRWHPQNRRCYQQCSEDVSCWIGGFAKACRAGPVQ
jgi:hypothetical protein